MNLLIETGGSLVGNASLPTGTLQALRIFGTTATINGTFGSTSAPGTNASIEAAVAGGKLTITGSGTFGPARVRVTTGDIGDTVVFDINTTFRYTGTGATTGGIGLYPQTDNDVFIVNAGKTLAFVDYSSLAVANNAGSAGASNLIINVSGAIDLSGLNSSLTLNAVTGKTVAMNIAASGSVTVGGNVYTSTVADGGTTTLVVNGSMTAGGQVDFSNPSFLVTGTGTFTVPLAANLMVGHAGGIAASGSTGQIRTTSRVFTADANYSYVGTSAQITGNGLPSNVADFTVNNAAGVSLTNTTTVDDTLLFTSGNIITGANILTMATTSHVVRTSGHVVGTLQKTIPVGTPVNATFEIGTGSSYAPVDLSFTSVSGTGTIDASTVSGDHPNIGTSSIDAAKGVNSYWKLTNSGITFTTYDATLHFAAGDVDAGAGPGLFIAERYNGASWSGLTEGALHSTSAQVTGVTTFSDFAVGQQTGAGLAPAFELSSTSLNLGSVLVGSNSKDSVYVRNIGTGTLNISSILSDNSPTFTVTPSSATVAAADSVKVKVTFSPSSTGAKSGHINFTDDAADSPQSLNLSGTGTSPLPVQSNGTGGGAWASGATWQGGNVPSTFDSVEIRATDSVWVAAEDTCRGIRVFAGGKLGLYDTLMADNATVRGSVYANASGRFDISDSCRFESGSVYDHARDAGNLPMSAWTSGSALRITGAATAAPANGNQNFYNIVWNSPSQSANLNLGWDSVHIDGDITIINTGVARWQMTAPAAGDSSWVVLNGNIIQSGGQFSSNGTSNANTKVKIDQYGSTTVTGGNFSVSRGSQGSGTGSTRWYFHNGDFSMSNATTQNSNPTNARFIFDKPGTQVMTLGSGNTVNALPIEVAGGTTLNMGASAVAGNGVVMIDASATVQTTLAGGVDAAFSGAGTKTLNTASSYTFSGSSAQVTGELMPDTLHNLTVNNASGVTLSDSIRVEGTLSLLNGDLITGDTTVTLGASGVLSETAGNTVIGHVSATRTMVLNTDESFGGIGLTLNAAGAAPGSTTVTRTTGVAQTGGPYSSILRSFDVTPAVNTALNARVDYFYDNSELNGQDANTLQLWKSTDAGSTWTFNASSVSTILHRVRATGVPSFARFAASDINHPLGAAGHIYSYLDKWNLVSLSLSVVDPRQSTLFPTAISRAYAYQNVYVIKDTLIPGIGYWLKFNGAQGLSIDGVAITQDTVNLSIGWNMIGAVTDSVATGTAQVEVIPPGIVTSPYFGYSGSYVTTTTLRAGKAYWVKANATGKIVLNSGATIQPKQAPVVDPLAGFSTLAIQDAAGNRQMLYVGDGKADGVSASYELPPVPPAPIFDARFGSQRMVETYEAANRNEKRYALVVQGEEYPLTLTWNMRDASRTFALTGLPSGQRIQLDGSGSVTLDRPVQSLALVLRNHSELPVEFSLGANYPNPFNPTTSFIVGVPKSAAVDIAIYNLLGQKVRTLVHEELAAGYYQEEWNGLTDDQQLAGSGVYFVRMVSESFVAVHKIVMMK